MGASAHWAIRRILKADWSLARIDSTHATAITALCAVGGSG